MAFMVSWPLLPLWCGELEWEGGPPPARLEESLWSAIIEGLKDALLKCANDVL